MAYNLFVAYDLLRPGQNYDAVRDAIKALGQWHQFQLSLFYLHTDLPPAAVYQAVWSVMDPDDRLIVIDAQSGIVSNAPAPLIEAINAIWHRP